MLLLFVGLTGVYLIDIFCSGIQFYLGLPRRSLTSLGISCDSISGERFRSSSYETNRPW